MQGELKEKASDTRFVFRPVRERKTDTDWTVFAENALSSLYLSYRFDRGFTGHEHYADLKVINMNGRLYDPVIARFFSPDNFVQLPDFTQNYNRYSYCLNNPLQYVDPSGESFLAAAFAIGALTNVFFQMISGNINNGADFMFSAFVGGLAGSAGASVGHELTHAYHHYILPNFTYTWNKIYSERAAYQYSFNVYTRYGYLHKAISTMAIARSLNYWGAYPEIYASPFF